MSVEKIRRVLGWHPRYTFREAIDELRALHAAGHRR
jgi:nucleoside-diphosphate-sugar epimerase